MHHLETIAERRSRLINEYARRDYQKIRAEFWEQKREQEKPRSHNDIDHNSVVRLADYRLRCSLKG